MSELQTLHTRATAPPRHRATAPPRHRATEGSFVAHTDRRSGKARRPVRSSDGREVDLLTLAGTLERVGRFSGWTGSPYGGPPWTPRGGRHRAAGTPGVRHQRVQVGPPVLSA